MDTGKSIWIQKSSRVVKGLIVSYLVSGTGLLLLALLLLKCQLDEGKVSAGILAVYVLSGLCGGIYMGKTAERKRYLWGMVLGGMYWIILMSITVFSGAGIGTGVKGDISYAAHLSPDRQLWARMVAGRVKTSVNRKKLRKKTL